MPERRGADLQIAIAVQDETVQVRLRGPNSAADEVFQGDVSVLSLGEHRASLGAELDALRGKVGERLKKPEEMSPKDIADIGAGLESLYKLGRRVLDYLVGDDMDRLVEFCRATCRSPLETGYRPLVAVRAKPMLMLPFEILPIWRVTPWPRITDWNSLRSAAQAFPAFSAQVVRFLPPRRDSPLDTPLEIRGNPAVPVQVFQNMSLKFAQAERDFFSSGGQFHPAQAWPDRDVTGPDALGEFCERFWEQSGRNQIHHFCCHFHAPEPLSVRVAGGVPVAITPELLSEQAYFEFSFVPGRSIAVQLRDVIDKFLDFKTTLPRNAAAAMPLVFVNACGTSEVNPTGVLSFPYLVNKYGYRGFIGTEARVPDEFARQFAVRFYTALFDRGTARVSQALSGAKEAMLRDFLNPLGVLYSEYGEPDLFVSRSETEDKNADKSHDDSR